MDKSEKSQAMRQDFINLDFNVYLLSILNT